MSSCLIDTQFSFFPYSIANALLLVCYYVEHYICFVYNRAKENWILYDDDKVKVIGSWDGVLAMCSRELLQPLILFFEEKGSVPITPLEETKEPDNPREAQKAERKRSGNHGKAKQDMDLGDERPFSHPLQRRSNSVIYVLEGDLGNHSYGYTSMQNCVKDYTFKISTLDYKTDEEAFEGFICLKSCKGLYVVDGFMLDNNILLVERLGPDLATYFQNEYTTFIRRGRLGMSIVGLKADIKEDSNRLQSVSRKIARYMRHLFEHANSSFPVHMRMKKEIIVQMGDEMFGGTAGLLRRACNNYFFISGQIASSNTEWWGIMKFLLSDVDY
ncbi:Inactive ubiquitin carboxyl-terminal hydrolase 53 [Camellia lanceoleosa]|uniref:Inactive ubiquitin carboxyl-terminal hydrolase 53 n=1 Tax=Camellia lanceoleosa TaxID=1840588 RepID=A0ACC0J4L6_9ERIC|nr:Inactive ubiquitin carboxyl-terminal hydrolase 53 [Camellia lanceoleosa]